MDLFIAMKLKWNNGQEEKNLTCLVRNIISHYISFGNEQ